MLASPAIADEAFDDLVDGAYDAFAVSDYDTAIADYKKAYRLSHDPRWFYNLALSHRKRFQLAGALSDATEARDYFSRFIELVDPDAPEHAADRTRLEKTIVLARGYVAELDKTLAAPPRPQPQPQPQEREPQLASPPERVPPHDAQRPRRWGHVLLVTAGALAVGGGTTGVLALQRERESADALESGDILGARASGIAADRYALATDILLGAALVSGGLGLYLALSGDEPADGASVALGVTPSQFSASLTVRY
jgi:tetratricopeptide (TPR) repeat protein